MHRQGQKYYHPEIIYENVFHFSFSHRKYEGPKDDICVGITHTFEDPEETENSMKHFMAVAVLTSMKSRDPRTQVGACIVKGDKVIGAGHNQMPNDHTEKYTWSRDKSMDNKYLYVCHAELNAILSSTDAKDCTIYVTLFPCSDCAKLLIQAGIKRVIYLSDKYTEFWSKLPNWRMQYYAYIQKPGRSRGKKNKSVNDPTHSKYFQE
uniref:dCMP deaminase n=1 Tax=Periophthalmus magnuspinnatus TaxID=409849 RepID=A0A3B4AUI9_9GOBI